MIKSHMHPLIYGIEYAFVTLSNSHSSPWIVITSKDILLWLYPLLKL